MIHVSEKYTTINPTSEEHALFTLELVCWDLLILFSAASICAIFIIHLSDKIVMTKILR